MESILQKLNETKQFYNDALKNFEKNEPEYIHYLNACVNSARSVTFILQKTGRNLNKQKFDKWYEQEKSKIFDKEDNDFVSLRNISEKQKPINSKQRIISGTIGAPNQKFENVCARIKLETLTAEARSISDGKSISVPTSPVGKDIVVEEFDDDKKKIVRKEHFIKSLGLYIAKLETIVKDYSDFIKHKTNDY